jgi:nuclear pore complex protein Nup93
MQQQQPGLQSLAGLQAGQLLNREPISSEQAPKAAFFSSLLERGKKRPHGLMHTGPASDVPSLQLGLNDIRRSARGLGGNDHDGLRHPGADHRA